MTDKCKLCGKYTKKEELKKNDMKFCESCYDGYLDEISMPDEIY
jgi:ribosome-binding protein aMBF1 (putative translation factor)